MASIGYRTMQTTAITAWCAVVAGRASQSQRGGFEARHLTTNGQAKVYRRRNEAALGGTRGEKVFFFWGLGSGEGCFWKAKSGPSPGSLAVSKASSWSTVC
jgi:hypothetical protein